MGLCQPRGRHVHPVQRRAQVPRGPRVPGEVPLPRHSLPGAGGQDHGRRQHRLQPQEGDRPAARHQASTRREDLSEAKIYLTEIQRHQLRLNGEEFRCH